MSEISIYNLQKIATYGVLQKKIITPLSPFDADFRDLATLYGHPPKIVWLRFGNTLTHHLATRIIERADLIRSFIVDPSFAEVGCLEIDS